MERVAFLIEQSGARLTCLLNPESVVLRRSAGIKQRQSLGGALTLAGASDEPLIYSGGGVTELCLDLLFDVALAGASVQAEDVRVLTGPFWDLAENAGSSSEPRARPPLVTFIWGASLRMTGVVAAVAERLEHFTADGTPRRSWLRMRMLRAPQALRSSASPGPTPEQVQTLMAGANDPLSHTTPVEAPAAIPPRTQVLIGGDSGPGEPLPMAAHQHYGNPGAWRLLAGFNNIIDPLRVAAGTVLQIPRITPQQAGSSTGQTPATRSRP